MLSLLIATQLMLQVSICEVKAIPEPARTESARPQDVVNTTVKTVACNQNGTRLGQPVRAKVLPPDQAVKAITVAVSLIYS